MTPVLFAALFGVGVLICILLFGIWRSRRELEASRAEAQHLAFHDNLTGLPNRALFENRLELALSRREPSVAVLLLDLDRFKNVNDTLGHQAGDALIREFGLRVAELTRACDTISRFGGDEFAILVEQAQVDDVHGLAKRILEVVRRPFDIVGAQVYAGASIGVAISRDQDVDRLELVRRADIAMYRAKEAGGNAYCLFTPQMDESVKLRGRTEEQLRDAVATGQGLTMHYQPQVRPDGTIVGLEALVRWEHPERGLIAPGQFISVAEETGLIVPLGEWAVREACLASLRWPGLFIAVNLSPVQFRSSDFVARLVHIVRENGAEPSALQLEVTERVLLDDDESVTGIVAELRSAGFKIVLDDFGTGYSSLSYLRKFEVDKIKIDGSFVSHLGGASDSRAIVAAVLALGNALGVAVAAEGVETEEQMTFLQLAGCKEMQGHYFSRALPSRDVSALLDDNGRSTAAA
jgi:diguanylate cyclase (GGDEF)-like protein